MVVVPFLRNNPPGFMFFQRFIFPAKAFREKYSERIWVFHCRYIRRKCKNWNPEFYTNGLPAMKNPDALRIFFPECFGGKYKPLKKHKTRRIIS
jgi:hypothetical protein